MNWPESDDKFFYYRKIIDISMIQIVCSLNIHRVLSMASDDLDYFLDIESFAFWDCEHAFEKILNPPRNLDVGWEHNLSLHFLHQFLKVLVFLPWEQVVEDFVENYSAAPNITFDGVRFPEYNLRGHVNRCSYINIIVPTQVLSEGLFFFYYSAITFAKPKSEIFIVSELKDKVLWRLIKMF